jgi:hypothetical protein
VRQGIGLAGTGTGNDQKWAGSTIQFGDAMLDGTVLFRGRGIDD